MHHHEHELNKEERNIQKNLIEFQIRGTKHLKMFLIGFCGMQIRINT